MSSIVSLNTGLINAVILAAIVALLVRLLAVGSPLLSDVRIGGSYAPLVHSLVIGALVALFYAYVMSNATYQKDIQNIIGDL